jgi:flavin-dependent dehydrogenase
LYDGQWSNVMVMRLLDGDRVCIVGGGPAGSFAALHLLRRMRATGLDLEVLVFEPRDFSMPGPGGCNRCAGILSTSLLRGLDDLDLELPTDVVQAELTSYSLHLDDDLISISRPDPSRRIVSTYRGGGPRLSTGEGVASFDAFLLNQAIERGATHIPDRVHSIEPGQRPLLRTIHERYQADLVILATGVNSRPPLAEDFGYVRPKTAIMAQDEFMRPQAWPEERVSAYFDRPPGLIFGVLIPKGRYINVSLLGKNMSRDAVNEFLEAQRLGEFLQSQPKSLCGCTPRIAVSPARHYFGDRWVAVGDAAVTRLYKDGIGSAFSTAKVAVESAMDGGVSAQAFRRRYGPFCRGIARDNRYGRLLFSLWDQVLTQPSIRKIWVRMLHLEEDLPPKDRVHSRIIWGMLTGDEAYRDLFYLSFSLRTLWGMWRTWAKMAWSRI